MFPNNPAESADSDGDGVGNNADAFPNNPNESSDSDGDGVGDNADAFPNDANETTDSDGDGIGDNSDPFPNDPGNVVDSDGDGVVDIDDAFPNDPTESADSDGDGVGNNADAFPNNPNESSDSDGDGVGNNADAFPNNPNESVDSDGDGVGDNSDAFPNNPNESADTDGDGVGDNADAFPNDANESSDTDGDGVGNNSDAFPNDPTETIDSDGDGIGDNSDPFPNDPTNNVVPVTNVALGQSAVQSSTSFNGAASRAVDGNTDGVYLNASVTHTGFEVSPWWQVDLGEVYDLETIVVWNRTDNCCVQRLTNFDVLISDVPFVSNNLNDVRADANVLSTNHPGTAAPQTNFDINRTGRFVRIQLVGDGEPLSLAEVQVFGRPFVDSDGDGVSDSNDAFPNDPSETADSDGDGIGDNSDIDADNDGLRDSAELAGVGVSNIQLIDDFESDLGWVTNPFGTDTANTGFWEVGNPGATVDGGVPIQLGFTTSGTNALITAGQVGTGVGTFDIDAGVTSALSPEIQVPTGTQQLRFNYNFAHRDTAEPVDFFRVAVRVNGSQQTLFEQFAVNGLQRGGQWLPVSVDISSFAGQSIRLLVSAADISGTIVEAAVDDLEFQVGVSISSDPDADNISNPNDLDSDNDSIADVVEIGLSDADNDFIVDNLVALQGSVSVARDSDGDGIPDFLDLESNNAANDGTAYDINIRNFASLDTNGDGMINSQDAGGGGDADTDGIDDLIDGDPTARGNGNSGTTTPLAGLECFEPVFDRSVDRALFVWRDCPGGQWNVRLTNGGDVDGVNASGNITTSAGFSSTSEFSLEANDLFDTTSNLNVIEYAMRVTNAAQDGFGFSPNSSSTCLTVESDAPVLLGETRVPVSPTLNLSTLQSCGTQFVPPQCGEPTFDADTEPGLFLWQDCDASAGGDDQWRLRVVGGGMSFAPYQGLLTSSNSFSSIQGFSIEVGSEDTFDSVPGDNELDFILFVANAGVDGIDMAIPSGGQTCFDAQSLPFGAQVFVGRDRQLMNQAFNLQDLGNCQ